MCESPLKLPGLRLRLATVRYIAKTKFIRQHLNVAAAALTLWLLFLNNYKIFLKQVPIINSALFLKFICEISTSTTQLPPMNSHQYSAHCSDIIRVGLVSSNNYCENNQFMNYFIMNMDLTI